MIMNREYAEDLRETELSNALGELKAKGRNNWSFNDVMNFDILMAEFIARMDVPGRQDWE